MKALVTGANGFVGSHLTERLVADGAQVTCLVRRTSDLRWLEDVDVRLVYGDVTAPETLEEAVAGQDVVYHTAGMLRGRDYAAYQRVNADGTRYLADACARADHLPRRFVYCSSLAASGPSTGPTPQTEDKTPNPLDDYGRSKLAGETVLHAIGAGALPYVIFRPPAVYGPRETDVRTYFRLIHRRIAPVVGDGKQTFDVLYVADLVDALILGAESDDAVGRTYFLNDGASHTWRAFSEEIARSLGVRPIRVRIPLGLLSVIARVAEAAAAIRRAPAVLHRQKVRQMRETYWTADSSAARRELGFEPQYDLRRGVESTARWYLENGWL